jgi:hypothetical protein
MKSFIYGHIHPCRWIKITLDSKFQAESSKLKLHVHAQAILHLTFLIIFHLKMIVGQIFNLPHIYGHRL